MSDQGVTGRLSGKAGVITGATSGLGLATLRAMTSEGAAIVAVGRNADRGQEIAEALQAEGRRAAFFTGDVSREADIVAAIDLCRKTFGSIDIMHNNAAFFTTAELHETTNEQWDKSLSTNLSSVFWGSKHAVLAMREQGRGGSIINTASVATFTATADTLAYVATKTGVMGLTRATALAYAAEGIRCNAVCPGDFESPILEQFFAAAPDPESARESIAATYPTKRILSPDDVARVVLYLASDDSNGVTGTSIVVDDGLLAKTY
ncbi:SDR family oxidoreductase [Sphingomonas histidinilytica]|uniref:SDR family NAD(P)-dependent oxidoreductase n=1 Tax=Rhizorhabdus histidinilytica TaxID=439228 RepID=UPI001ADD2BE4|nr:SDR family oxidoreductase [Rhizorhabdus histidinilytica]MBO9378856.1 SDR family oxidoreductase [Rhizorhabdus histidinilytica]